MDERLPVDTQNGSPDDHAPAADPAVVEETSLQFLGHWNRLISTTNWEKGRIIAQWRQKLIQAGAPPADYSDEAWSRRVGNVSPQHVGRLRRVFGRFGEVYADYSGLFWSHFQAALDWNDAEMWLEGAVQNDWSVAGMRHQRWQTIGAPPEMKPRDEDVIVAELDEDVDPADDGSAGGDGPMPESISGQLDVVQDAGGATHDDRQSPGDEAAGPPPADDADPYGALAQPAVDPVRPFENLPPLPADLGEAMELFKLAILNHKVSGWQEISCPDVLAVLEALKQLALAPADD